MATTTRPRRLLATDDYVGLQTITDTVTYGGTVVDLSDAEVVWRVYRSAALDADLLLEFDADIDSAEAGTVTVDITADQLTALAQVGRQLVLRGVWIDGDGEHTYREQLLDIVGPLNDLAAVLNPNTPVYVASLGGESGIISAAEGRTALELGSAAQADAGDFDPAGAAADALADATALVTAEGVTRAAGDATNAAAISAEATTRASADSTEATARAAGDATNATAITTEATARAAGDATNAAAITAEASTRATADTANATAITNEATARAAADSSEATTRAAADTALDGRLDTIEADYTTAAQATTIASTAVAAAIDGAPGALDTLNELAAALGDDPNFATTITNALAGKQPLDSDLTAIAALTTTAFGRALLELANAGAARTALGLGTAAVENATAFDVAGAAAAAQAASQPLDSDLTAIAALTTTAFGRGLLALADAAALRTAAGLVIGTDVQAYDADLGALAGLTSAADKVPYFTGSATAAVADSTSFGRGLWNLANATALGAAVGLPLIGTALADGDDILTLPAGVLERSTNGRLRLVTSTTTGNEALAIRRSGDSGNRVQLTDAGVVLFGDGAGVNDTNLYRFGTDRLRTDDNLQVMAGINVGSTISTTATDGQIRMTSTAPSVYFDRGGTSEFLIYEPSAAQLHIRDMVNSRSMQVIVPGASAAASSMRFDSYVMIGQNTGPAAPLEIRSQVAATKAFIVRAAASQSGVLTEYQDSAGTMMGVVTATARFGAASGDTTTPGFHFAYDTNTGIYRVGADELGLVAGGTSVVNVATTGAAVAGTLSATSTFQATTVKATGRTGSTGAVVLAGRNTSGAPTTGTGAVGDIVADDAGKLYLCITAGSPGTWVSTSLVSRGTWSGAVAYSPNDWVRSGGSAWVALRANTNVTPVEGADWTLLAADGVNTSRLLAGPNAVASANVATSSTTYADITGLTVAPATTSPIKVILEGGVRLTTVTGWTAGTLVPAVRLVSDLYTSVTDGTTASNTTVTSATANFTTSMIGEPIQGGTIPMGTVITARASSTSVTISQAATGTASGVTILVGVQSAFAPRAYLPNWVSNTNPAVEYPVNYAWRLTPSNSARTYKIQATTGASGSNGVLTFVGSATSGAPGCALVAELA